MYFILASDYRHAWEIAQHERLEFNEWTNVELENAWRKLSAVISPHVILASCVVLSDELRAQLQSRQAVITDFTCSHG